MIRCIGCGTEFDDINEFEDHLLKYHFLHYRDYCELELMKGKDEDFYCYRCNRYRNPMTFLMREDYYLPCWNCMKNKKAERLDAISSIQKNIKEYYNKILGDRYYQLYIIDDIYFQSTLPHSYLEFKKVLGMLSLPSRNDIWFVDWELGYPKIISEQNIKGIKIINLSDYYKVESTKDSLIINNYEILMPELVPYDVRHHCRYNLVSKTSDRRTKRIKISGSDKCVKFYNTKDNNIKSIFKIVDHKTKEDIDLSELTYQDFVIIKLALLRNKSYVRQIYDIIYEILKYCHIFRDSVFLKNTITVNPDINLRLFNLTWLPNDEHVDICDNNYINISIL